MSQFRNTSFSINNRTSQELKLKLVEVDNNSSEPILGLNRTIIKSDGVGDEPTIEGTKCECPTIPMTFCKMINNEPQPISDQELSEYIRIFTNDNKISLFQSKDNSGLCYYGIFTKSTKYFRNGANQGYFTLDFEMIQPWASSNINVTSKTVIGSRTVDLYNKTNIGKEVYVDIEVELINNNTSLEIANLTTGEITKVTGLLPNEKFKILGDCTHQIISITDKKRVLYGNFNKVFLRLVYGSNNILVKGDCKINFISQYAVALM